MDILKGKFAVITGAASLNGIGRKTANRFAEEGAQVAILDLDQNAAQQAADSLPGKGHISIACNVVDHQACQDAIAQVLKHFPQIDILVNNAGITQPLKVMDITPDNYTAVTDVSLRGTLNMSQAVIPNMRAHKSGSIICLSSVSAQRGGGIFGGPHYSAAKAGVLGLGKAMARELGSDNIRVNSITPGLIQTDITQGKLTDEMRADIIKGIALSRLGEGVDVANACVFLASDLSSYLTGITLDVNGGMHIH